MDISEILNELVNQIATAIYPDGLDQPSITTAPTRIYPGWPDAKSLDEDLTKGIVNVSVYPREGTGRVTTRFSKDWTYPTEIPVPTLTVEVVDRTVSFGGIGSEGLLAAIIEGNQSWPLKVQEGWSPERVCQEFKKTLRPGAINLGRSIMFPGGERLVARTAAAIPAQRELRRQTRGLQISVWAPSSTLRDKTFSAIDLWVAQHSFFQVQNFAIRLQYSGDAFDEDSRQANLYRRDLLATVEYPTIDKTDAPPVVIPVVNIVVDPGGHVIKTFYP